MLKIIGHRKPKNTGVNQMASTKSGTDFSI
jgi:hypothetical protein